MLLVKGSSSSSTTGDAVAGLRRLYKNQLRPMTASSTGTPTPTPTPMPMLRDLLELSEVSEGDATVPLVDEGEELVVVPATELAAPVDEPDSSEASLELARDAVTVSLYTDVYVTPTSTVDVMAPLASVVVSTEALSVDTSVVSTFEALGDSSALDTEPPVGLAEADSTALEKPWLDTGPKLLGPAAELCGVLETATCVEVTAADEVPAADEAATDVDCTGLNGRGELCAPWVVEPMTVEVATPELGDSTSSEATAELLF